MEISSSPRRNALNRQVPLRFRCPSNIDNYDSFDYAEDSPSTSFAGKHRHISRLTLASDGEGNCWLDGWIAARTGASRTRASKPEDCYAGMICVGNIFNISGFALAAAPQGWSKSGNMMEVASTWHPVGSTFTINQDLLEQFQLGRYMLYSFGFSIFSDTGSWPLTPPPPAIVEELIQEATEMAEVRSVSTGSDASSGHTSIRSWLASAPVDKAGTIKSHDRITSTRGATLLSANIKRTLDLHRASLVSGFTRVYTSLLF